MQYAVCNQQTMASTYMHFSKNLQVEVHQLRTTKRVGKQEKHQAKRKELRADFGK